MRFKNMMFGMMLYCMFFLIAGCMTRTQDPIPGNQVPSAEMSLTPAGISQNGISQNGISQNGISQNGISQNALSLNDLSSSNEAMRYAVRCALDASQSVTTPTGDVWPGLLGIAPEWTRRALTLAEQESVSGCLLAHVNVFGQSVPISVRGLPVSSTDDERLTFLVHEGAFYGNLFVAPLVKHTCSTGRLPPSYLLKGRACTLPGVCGFTWDGFCDDVCSKQGDVYVNCNGFSNVITTYLQ